MMADTIPTRRRRWWLVALAVAAAALAAGAALWPASVMYSRVTIASEGREPITVLEAQTVFSRCSRPRVVVEKEIDLAQWAGELVRVEVQGGVAPRVGILGLRGRVGCAGEVATPQGVESVEFAGWPEDDRRPFHVSGLGPASYRVGAGRGEPFSYASEGDLWHVLRVSEGAKLRVALRPVVGAAENGGGGGAESREGRPSS
jgi:hypothetical protein